MALTSDGPPLTQVDDIAENVISPTLSTLPGVAQAVVYGAQTYAVRIDVDPRKLDSRGLSMTGLAKALSNANDQTPVGTIQNQSQLMTIDGGYAAHRCGAVPHAGHRAEPTAIWCGSAMSPTCATASDRSIRAAGSTANPAIVLAVQRQPDANTVAVVDAIRAKLPEIAGGAAGGRAYQHHERRLGLDQGGGRRMCRARWG